MLAQSESQAAVIGYEVIAFARRAQLRISFMDWRLA